VTHIVLKRLCLPDGLGGGERGGGGVVDRARPPLSYQTANTAITTMASHQPVYLYHAPGPFKLYPSTTVSYHMKYEHILVFNYDKTFLSYTEILVGDSDSLSTIQIFLFSNSYKDCIYFGFL
jgi:hypothetical protein